MENLDNADVWTVLDLIVAEFTSDPMSTACFDARLVRRAIVLNRAHQAEAATVTISGGVLIDRPTVACALRTMEDTLRTLMGTTAADPYVRAISRALEQAGLSPQP